MAKMSDRIKKLREAAALTQQDLAVAVGVTVSQVYRWEKGTHMPNVYALRSLARVFKVSLDELIGKE